MGRFKIKPGQLAATETSSWSLRPLRPDTPEKIFLNILLPSFIPEALLEYLFFALIIPEAFLERQQALVDVDALLPLLG